MKKGHSKRWHVIDFVVIGGGVVLLVCAVAVLAVRSGRRETPLPPMLEATDTPNAVQVKSVARKDVLCKPAIAASTSRAVTVVCGVDAATASRYEARNDALRSIMRSRSLTKDDATALMDYLASTNDLLRMERVAALKNDVMNLLRSQETPV